MSYGYAFRTGAAVCLPPPTSIPGQLPYEHQCPATQPGILAAPLLTVPSGALAAATSTCGIDLEHTGTSLPPGQANPLVAPSDVLLPDDMDEFSEVSNSPSVTVINDNGVPPSSLEPEPLQHVLLAKHRRNCKRSYIPLDISTLANPLRHGLLVVIKQLTRQK